VKEIKRTPLRHRLLAEVANGNRHIYHGLQWTLIHSDGSWCKPGEVQSMKVLRLLVDSGQRLGSNESMAVLNEAGKDLLANWNVSYGEVPL
jgi:hypothetical protein